MFNLDLICFKCEFCLMDKNSKYCVIVTDQAGVDCNLRVYLKFSLG